MNKLALIIIISGVLYGSMFADDLGKHKSNNHSSKLFNKTHCVYKSESYGLGSVIKQGETNRGCSMKTMNIDGTVTSLASWINVD